MAGLILRLDSVQPVLVFLGVRVVLGFALSFSGSMVAVAIAWGFYVFAGATSQITLLALFTSAAGIGAGLGTLPAWLNVNFNARSTVILNISLGIIAGVGGSWGGLWYSAVQVVECCAKPGIAPFTFVAIGATVVASGVGVALGIAQGTMVRRPTTARPRL